MTPTLDQVLPSTLALLAANPALVALPRIEQNDPDYNKKFEGAMKTPGMAIVAWLAGGRPADGSSQDQLALDNLVILSLVENPAKNTTSHACFYWGLQVLKTLHRAGQTARRGLPAIRHDDETVYDLGPLRTGLVMYFFNFRVRSIDPLA
jgi:hypothetical protein